jgi:hypothetical protein
MYRRAASHLLVAKSKEMERKRPAPQDTLQGHTLRIYFFKLIRSHLLKFLPLPTQLGTKTVTMSF